ncbi:MAG: DUF2339 domain-containing protein [Spirochaetes bacterium]|jgi:uncharacterized membrane protein|nr:DUF2339 domain-containing protein [Spirochaetota bacterium]
MNILLKLKQQRLDHQKSHVALTKLLAEIESLDLIHENNQLKTENDKLRESIKKSQAEISQVQQKNYKLKEALTEQIIDERLSIIKLSRKKMGTLFINSENSNQNRLSVIEKRYKKEIENYKKRVPDKYINENEIINKEITATIGKIEEITAEIRQKEAEKLAQIRNASDQEYNELIDSGLDDKTIEKRVRQNRIEMKIGLNFINRAGIILILLGIGATTQYSYTHFFNDYLKGSLFFVIGLLLSLGGELTFRKRMPTFSAGLTGGGIAALYGALFYSHFVLSIITVVPAIGLSVIIAFASILLTIRYNSQIIAIITLVGGFLPFFSYSFNFDLSEPSLHTAMLYLLLLNGILIALSYMKSWQAITVISFVMNIPCALYLVSSMANFQISVLYLFLIFAIYQAAVLLKPLRHKTDPSIFDLILLFSNSSIISLSVFLHFNFNGYTEYDGLLALIFALLFIIQGLSLYLFFSQISIATIIMFGGALTFSALAIPFQFGMEWALFGWIVEALFLVVAGNRYRISHVEKMGWIITGLSIFIFYSFDLLPYINGETVTNFTFKFITVSIASLLLLTYYRTYSKPEEFPEYRTVFTGFTFFTLFTVWVMILTLIPLHIKNYFSHLLPESLIDFYVLFSLSLAHLAYGLFITSVPLFRERIYSVFPSLCWIFSCLILLALNVSTPVLPGANTTAALHSFTFGLLIIYNILFILLVRYLILKILKSKLGSLEIYPPAVALWILSAIISILIVQFDLSFHSLTLSIIVLLFSLGAVTYGFIRNYRFIRIMGLGLVIVSLAKFFIIDLSGLETGYKIIAYFSYGLILISISFIYQKLKQAVEKS